jgi:hypothetical protein
LAVIDIRVDGDVAVTRNTGGSEPLTEVLGQFGADGVGIVGSRVDDGMAVVVCAPWVQGTRLGWQWKPSLTNASTVTWHVWWCVGCHGELLTCNGGLGPLSITGVGGESCGGVRGVRGLLHRRCGASWCQWWLWTPFWG